MHLCLTSRLCGVAAVGYYPWQWLAGCADIGPAVIDRSAAACGVVG